MSPGCRLNYDCRANVSLNQTVIYVRALKAIMHIWSTKKTASFIHILMTLELKRIGRNLKYCHFNQGQSGKQKKKKHLHENLRLYFAFKLQLLCLFA